ncbi:MAG: carbohydrate binding family 9 domain-containing protein [Planctomycetota bacterium]|jgi:hypothetical protein
MRYLRTCCTWIMILWGPITLLPGQDLQQPVRPRVAIPLVREAPAIDGKLEERTWKKAGRIRSLTEVDPDEGAAADPPTHILVMRDEDYLYVAFICFEPEPRALVLQDMHRDAFQFEDDAVKIALDPFRDGKTGFYFLISAAGSRLDALVADNGERLNFSWDGFWQARAHIGADRWTAEFAIPFKTLSFGEDDLWRVNFERWRGVDRTKYRWTGWQREYRVTTVSEAGEMEGMAGIEQAMGIEFVPYTKVKYERTHKPRSAHTLGDVGGEVNIAFTPQLAGSFTVNTDFAETEADARRINLTRFPLFFPEKRDFFLQDSTYFEFGWESGFTGSPDLVPYFSRRIGLAEDGEEIPIEYGGRTAGRIDRLDLGVLGVHTDSDSSADVPSGDLFVARPAFRVNNELTVGGIVTSGDPASRKGNMTGGADIRFVSTDTLPGLWAFNAYVLRSEDEGTDRWGMAYGFQTSLKTSDWFFAVDSIYSQDEFHPALGFVRRLGERSYNGDIEWEPRPDSGPIRNFEFGFHANFWLEPDSSVITKNFTTTLFEADLHSGDEFFIQHIYSYDKLDQVFEPVAGNPIPPGTYDWQNIRTGLDFSRSRPLSGRITYQGGSWYNGRTTQYRARSTWSPSAHLQMSLDYNQNRIRLPSGNFTTRIQTLNVNYDFTPDIRLATLVQADNVSDNLGLQSRFRWIIEDGRELFFVINSSWIEESDGSIVPVEQDYTVKLEYTLRF